MRQPRVPNCCVPTCLSNQRQLEIAFLVWANDNEDKYPWLLSTKKGGTLEHVATGEVSRHFQIASDAISNPRVLWCPMDTNRLRAVSFTNQLSNANLSYFIGLDANDKLPQTILLGDRNITSGKRRAGGIRVLTTNSHVGWSTNLHNGKGYIGLADGSVQQGTTSGLRQQVESALRSANLESLRLAIP
jgi:hypothetical protein